MGLGNELSAADVAAVTNNGNNGWGNDWWIILLVLFGWGGNRGGFGSTGSCASTSDVYNAVDQQTLISKLDQQTYGLADATFALNNSITTGFYNAELSRCNQHADLMMQLNNMAAEQAKCCCESRFQAEKNTRDIIENANCNTRAILDFLTQDKISALQAENQTLKLAASQSAQNNYLLSQLRPDPIPAYVVQNPNCCYNSCGCGA